MNSRRIYPVNDYVERLDYHAYRAYQEPGRQLPQGIGTTTYKSSCAEKGGGTVGKR